MLFHKADFRGFFRQVSKKELEPDQFQADSHILQITDACGIDSKTYDHPRAKHKKIALSLKLANWTLPLIPFIISLKSQKYDGFYTFWAFTLLPIQTIINKWVIL